MTSGGVHGDAYFLVGVVVFRFLVVTCKNTNDFGAKTCKLYGALLTTPPPAHSRARATPAGPRGEHPLHPPLLPPLRPPRSPLDLHPKHSPPFSRRLSGLLEYGVDDVIRSVKVLFKNVPRFSGDGFTESPALVRNVSGWTLASQSNLASVLFRPGYFLCSE